MPFLNVCYNLARGEKNTKCGRARKLFVHVVCFMSDEKGEMQRPEWKDVVFVCVQCMLYLVWKE